MVGVGGNRFAEGHVADTPPAVLRSMLLDRWTSSVSRALWSNRTPPESRRQQAEALRAGLRALAGPRVAPYALEAFLYG